MAGKILNGFVPLVIDNKGVFLEVNRNFLIKRGQGEIRTHGVCIPTYKVGAFDHLAT